MPGNRNSKGKYKKPAPEKLDVFPQASTVDLDTFADELPLLNAHLVPKFVHFATKDGNDEGSNSLDILCNFRQIGIARAGEYPDKLLLSFLIAKMMKYDKISLFLAKPFPPYPIKQNEPRHSSLLVLSRWNPTLTERILLYLMSDAGLWSEEDSANHPIIQGSLNAKLCLERKAMFQRAMTEGNVGGMMDPAITLMRLLQKHNFTAPITHPLLTFIRSHRWFDHSAFAPGIENMGGSGFYVLRTQSDHEAMNKAQETTYDKLDKLQPRS